MALPNMKSFMLCLALISLAMLNQIDAKHINPAVLDPCLRSGNKLPGCHANKGKPREEANKYNRGCLNINRCRNRKFK
ncbi:hypothetical protein JCGZ_15322 [Jatropha curcas]|uniref:Rapid ALkalinization Factor n=1 Tax=Jatropha curcas TaxID=180498 RepID=A0A067LF70_JATCU|nr:hypothetical protein JCGZ_15322 [Jatropha curcas]